MISVELAKLLIDRNYFRFRKEEGEGLLKDKLIHMSRMLLTGDGKEVEGTEFSMYIANDGLVYSGVGKSLQEFHNTACEEDGWSWTKITGPSSPTEYCYTKYFGGRNTDYFEIAYFLYFDLFRWELLEEAQHRIEPLLHCETLKELKGRVNELAVEVVDFDEIVNMLEWPQSGDVKLSESVNEVVAVKTMLLCAYYLYHGVNGTSMDAELRKLLNKNFCLCFPEEEVDGEEYMDCFLGVLEDVVDCSDEGRLMVMDLILNVHFSYAMDQHEKTPTFYFFKSKPLQEYKSLREKYEGNELVSYLDKLVPMLEDPAFMMPGECLFDFVLEPETCIVESGYTKEEYVCCYYYYERYWESIQEYVTFDYAFSIARKCFEVLFGELKNKMQLNLQN